MMRLIRLAIALILIILATVALWAQVTGVRGTVQPGTPPVLSSLSVTTGQYGTAVTVTGTGFGATQAGSFVAFNGLAAPVSSWSDTSILVAVPVNATSGNVIVIEGGAPSNAIAFTIPAPILSSLSIITGNVGDPITLTGSNFGTTQGLSRVTFNGTVATVLTWASTSITTTVPAGTTTGPVVVTLNGIASAGVTFTVSGGASAPWTGLLAPERAILWNYAGLPSGIPTTYTTCVTTACNTAFATPTAANLNTALAGAPNNTVVRIPAGTFSLSTSVRANRSNVILRGAGTTQTTLTLSGGNILMGNGSGNQGGTPSGLASTTLSTVAKGSTVLIVASTAGLSAGQIVAVLENNPAWVNPAGNEGNENSMWRVSPLDFFGGSAQSLAELVEIVTVDSSTQITIAAPGLSTTYTSGLTPRVISWATSGVYRNNGVENLTVNVSATNFAVAFVFCHYCWAKNLAVIGTRRSGIYSFFNYRAEFRDNYLSASNSAGAPTEYGLEIDRSSLVKVENNIFFGVTTPVIPESSSGLVVAYNYALRTPNDNMFSAFVSHRAHVWQSLYEGNITYRQQFDFVWGSGSHNTVFRSYLSGRHPNATNYRVPLIIDAYNRYMNVVGNVLGDPTAAWQTRYACDDLTPSPASTEGMIYNLDGNNGCDQSSPRDVLTRTSLVRWGNWDAVTYNASGAVHGTRWCTGSGVGSGGADAQNTACTVSDTASADPTFPGLASPTTTLPASFYLSAKPSWWGAVAWPPIGPDVTGGTIANTGGHANKIPAQLCYETTTKNASGFLTAFDAAICYP